MNSYTSNISWTNQFHDTLLIACSDGRFSTQLDSYCREYLGVESCDRFLAPGGIAGLQILAESFYADKERITLLVTRHAIRKIICVAHEDCGYYRERYPGIDDLMSRQLEDLRTAGESLRYWFGGMRVELAYAKVTPDRYVQFVRVSPAGTTDQ
jgi:Putative carbonic anhydrase